MTDSVLLADVSVGRDSERRRSDVLQAFMLVGTFLATTWYMAHMLDRGWVPHDEGLLAQSAERVLSGEVPHRDFDEAYTGALTYLNALAFRLWGVDLMSMRIMLLIFFMAWVPCFYYCATRLLSPVAASAVTMTAVAWGPPNYPAALPSWYNLFFATGVMAAVYRFLEMRRPGWLFIAGLLAGASCLFKVSGLYSIASVLLFLLFHACAGTGRRAVEGPGSRASLVLVAGAGAFFMFTLWHLVRPRLGWPEAVHFLLPGFLVACLIVTEEYRRSPLPFLRRAKSLTLLAAPFCLGALLPVAVLVFLFGAAGGLGDLWTGTGEQPLRRLVHAAVAPPPLVLLVPALWLAAAALLSSSRFRALQVVVPWVVGLVLAFLVIRASNPYEYQLAWHAVYGAPPIVMAMGVWRLQTPEGRALPSRERQQAALAFCSLGVFTLVQFPFSAPIYFCYVAPLLFLAVAALARLPVGYGTGFGSIVTVFALIFPVLRVAPGFVYNMGVRPGPDEQKVRLTMPRAGGLKVTKAEADEYSALVRLVHAHSSPGSSILVTPDAPEVYFLTQRRNPTRVFFDFFSPDPDQVLLAMRSGEVPLIVLNSRPGFSGTLRERVLDAAGLEYPNAARAGRFTVRWK